MPAKRVTAHRRSAYCSTASAHTKRGGKGKPKLQKCTAKSKSKYRKKK